MDMDFTHSPFLFWLVAVAGALLGVLVTVMALMMFRKPRGADAPPPRRGSGPGAPGQDGGDLG